MFHFILVSLLAHATNAWVLEPSDRQLYSGMATNVSLHCYYDNDDNGQRRIKEVIRLTIDKLQTTGPSIKIARVYRNRGSDVKIHSNLNITAMGHAENVDNSFLTVKWSDAFPDALGNYSCTIDGYDTADEVAIVTTDPVTLSETQCAAEDLSARTMAFENQYKRREKSILDALGQIQTLIDKSRQDLDAINEETEFALKNMTDELVVTKTTNDAGITADDTEEALEWPEGTFSLIRTKYGCPSSNVTNWIEARGSFYAKMNTLNNASASNHFAQPLFTNRRRLHYFHQCAIITNSSSRAWPKGTYCIGPACPPGFTRGHIELESHVTRDSCCRQDGSHDKPITLPVTRPFYLYRYGGKCQQVKNAVVSQEWVSLDTGRGTQKDKFINAYNSDATLNPFRYFMCYYQPR